MWTPGQAEAWSTTSLLSRLSPWPVHGENRRAFSLALRSSVQPDPLFSLDPSQLTRSSRLAGSSQFIGAAAHSCSKASVHHQAGAHLRDRVSPGLATEQPQRCPQPLGRPSVSRVRAVTSSCVTPRLHLAYSFRETTQTMALSRWASWTGSPCCAGLLRTT